MLVVLCWTASLNKDMQRLEMTPIEWRVGVTYTFEAPSPGSAYRGAIGILLSIPAILITPHRLPSAASICRFEISDPSSFPILLRTHAIAGSRLLQQRASTYVGPSSSFSIKPLSSLRLNVLVYSSVLRPNCPANSWLIKNYFMRPVVLFWYDINMWKLQDRHIASFPGYDGRNIHKLLSFTTLYGIVFRFHNNNHLPAWPRTNGLDTVYLGFSWVI